MSDLESIRKGFSELTDLENQMLQLLTLHDKENFIVAGRKINIDASTKAKMKSEVMKIKSEILTKLNEVRSEVQAYS